MKKRFYEDAYLYELRVKINWDFNMFPLRVNPTIKENEFTNYNLFWCKFFISEIVSRNTTIIYCTWHYKIKLQNSVRWKVLLLKIVSKNSQKYWKRTAVSLIRYQQVITVKLHNAGWGISAWSPYIRYFL